MESLSDRTAVCAAVSEHGCALEQSVPVPDGETYTVRGAADAGAGDAITAVAVKPTVAAPARSRLRIVRVVNTFSPCGGARAEEDDGATGLLGVRGSLLQSAEDGSEVGKPVTGEGVL
jgi:hypothetical protein